MDSMWNNLLFAVREGVGLLDIAPFSRYEVTGPAAERWLDWMTVARLPKAGRSRNSRRFLSRRGPARRSPTMTP